MPWRGCWDQFAWAIGRMADGGHSPNVSAQIVVEDIGDGPDLWAPGGGEVLMAVLARWDGERESRAAVDDALRAHLQGLAATDARPLIDTGA